MLNSKSFTSYTISTTEKDSPPTKLTAKQMILIFLLLEAIGFGIFQIQN